MMFAEVTLPAIVSTVVYTGVGLICFIIAYFLIEKLTPFSVRKEIEEDQNIALGLIIGLMMVGLAIIIGSAIMSPSDTKASRVNVQTPAAIVETE